MTNSAQLAGQDSAAVTIAPPAASPPSRKRLRSSNVPPTQHHRSHNWSSPPLRHGRHRAHRQSHHHHYYQQQQRPQQPPPEQESEYPRHQPSFDRLAQTISHAWEELNGHLQLPSLSIAKLHLETLALMRGLHGNHQRSRGQPGDIKALPHRPAVTARLLALETHLAGIRDNLSQVLATSHLMLRAAGDIDSELDSIAHFTQQSSFERALAIPAPAQPAPRYQRQRSSSSTPSLQIEDDPSPDGEEEASFVALGPLLPRHKRRSVDRVIGSARQGAAANQAPHSLVARPDYFVSRQT